MPAEIIFLLQRRSKFLDTNTTEQIKKLTKHNKYVRSSKTLGSLSTHDFETRTASGSELFSLITCLHTITCTAKYVSRLGMISIKSWEILLSWHTECSLPVAVRVSKMRVLKLPIIQNQGTGKCRFHLLSSLSSVLVYFLILNEKCHFVFH